MTTIGFVGAGQMAQALAGGIAESNSEVKFVVSDPSTTAVSSFCQKVAVAKCEAVDSNQEVFGIADYVFLAVKPQYFTSATDTASVQQALSRRDQSPVVVSVMAGVGIERIAKQCGVDAVVRIMPNTPCLVGAGASGMACSDAVNSQQRNEVARFISSTGMVVEVMENHLDAVTGLSGSGPAYIFELIDGLALGGVRSGLPRAVAQKLAVQTVFGAAKLALESEEHPSVLRDRVTSPGGTTIAGLKALTECGFRKAIIAAVEAATHRSQELGQEN